ncbi:hypothetical protein WCQ02_00325 [Paraburkholderia tropica]|uniref:hypothetical protein n=1 Tax=Paraburkholderia tropica TaxID=92647 RepID=UPI003016FBB2
MSGIAATRASLCLHARLLAPAACLYPPRWRNPPIDLAHEVAHIEAAPFGDGRSGDFRRSFFHRLVLPMFSEPGRSDTAVQQGEQCEHCGAAFHAPLIFCPRCGVNRLAAPVVQTRKGGAQTLSSVTMGSTGALAPLGVAASTALSPTRQPGARVAPARMPGVETPIRTFEYESHDEADFARRKRVPLVACASLTALAVLAAFLIGHRGDDGARASAAQVAEGAVIGRSPPADARSGAQPAVAAATATAATAVPAPRSGSKPPITSTSAAATGARTSSASKSAAGARSDVTANLASARAYLDQNRLAAAHAALARALAAQPDNDAAQRMRTELTTREQDRDTLLAYAHRCGRAGQWGCVRHDAARALAIDASSREARWWLARAANERSARYENASSERDQQDAGMMPRELPVWSHH